MDKIKGFFTAIAAPFMAGKRKRKSDEDDNNDHPAQDHLISNKKERRRDGRSMTSGWSEHGKAESSQHVTFSHPHLISKAENAGVTPPPGKRARFALPTQEKHVQHSTTARFPTSGLSTQNDWHVTFSHVDTQEEKNEREKRAKEEKRLAEVAIIKKDEKDVARAQGWNFHHNVPVEEEEEEMTKEDLQKYHNIVSNKSSPFSFGAAPPLTGPTASTNATTTTAAAAANSTTNNTTNNTNYNTTNNTTNNTTTRSQPAPSLTTLGASSSSARSKAEQRSTKLALVKNNAAPPSTIDWGAMQVPITRRQQIDARRMVRGRRMTPHSRSSIFSPSGSSQRSPHIYPQQRYFDKVEEEYGGHGGSYEVSKYYEQHDEQHDEYYAAGNGSDTYTDEEERFDGEWEEEEEEDEEEEEEEEESTSGEEDRYDEDDLQQYNATRETRRRLHPRSIDGYDEYASYQRLRQQTSERETAIYHAQAKRDIQSLRQKSCQHKISRSLPIDEPTPPPQQLITDRSKSCVPPFLLFFSSNDNSFLFNIFAHICVFLFFNTYLFLCFFVSSFLHFLHFFYLNYPDMLIALAYKKLQCKPV